MYEVTEERVKVVDIDAALLLRLLKACDGKQHVRVSDIPADARALSVGIDHDRRTLRILVESDSFPLVIEGCSPSTLIPQVTVTQ